MRSLCGVIALLLVPVVAQAAARSVTLDEAIAQALSRNNQLKADQYARDAVREGVAIGRNRYLPRVTFEESFAASNAPSRVFMMKLDQGRIAGSDFTPDAMNNPASSRDFRTALTLEQPLFDAGISRSLAVAKDTDRAADHQLARQREETAFQVFVAYAQVQRTKLHLEVADKAVLAAMEHERLTRARSAAGIGLKADELRARAFVSQMQQQSLTARNTLELAKLELARRLGEPPGFQLDIAAPVTPRPLAANGTNLVEQAMSSRQDLQAVAQQVARAGSAIGLARGSYLPTVYGTAGYEMHDRSTPFGRDNDGWYAGASLRWELFDGMRRPHAVEQASLQQRAAAAQLEEYRNAVAYQVTESLLRRDEAGKRLEMARHELLVAEEGMQLVQRRYENSLSLFVELLEAQTNLNRSQAQLVDQETNHAVAGAQVLHSAGLFLKEFAP